MTLKNICLGHWLLNSGWLGWVIIGLGSLSAAAQVDSLPNDYNQNSLRGTIRVVRPGIKPVVQVDMDYRLYKGPLTDGLDPKRIPKAPKGVAFVGDRTNVIANGAEYPVPSTLDIPGRDKYFVALPAELDSPIDGYINFDYVKYFNDNLGYTYPYSNTKRVDTVQLVLSIAKDGTFTFKYRHEKKKRSIVEEKGFESVGHILTWSPSKILIYSGDGSRLKRKKKTNCIVFLTLTITAQPGSENFDALWEEE